jgi:hypothetical protein
VLGQSLTTATLPGVLRLRKALGRDIRLGARDGLIALLGDESQLVRVDALAARSVPLAQQLVDRMLQEMTGQGVLLEDALLEMRETVESFP